MSEARARPRQGGEEWLPTLVLAGIVGLSFAAYNTAPPAVANVVVFVYAGSLVLGPSVIYPWLRGGGASAGRAAVGSLFVPLLWIVKECLAVSRVFGFAESLYYAFNPLALGLMFAAALQMSVAELLARRRRHGRWEVRNGAGLPLVVLGVVAASFALVAVREDPSYVFWVYIEIYRRLFGG
jgi:hypothetical protein